MSHIPLISIHGISVILSVNPSAATNYSTSNCLQKALYRALLQCAPAHRHFAEEVVHCEGIVADFPDGSECPICESTKQELPRIVSLDGNFRLVRKKSAGPSYCPPLHGSKFFLPSEHVDRFIRNAGDQVNVDVSIYI